MRKITSPLDIKTRKKLKRGEEALLSGTLYTARDEAHRRLCLLIKKKKKLPFDLRNAVIYYTGPTPAKGKFRVGSCGPTTSSRMDSFTPPLLKKGLAGMLGKGKRTRDVREHIKKYKAVYFLAIGGAGAYLSERVVNAKIIAFKDLGTESIYKLEVKDFPVIVGIDARGKDVYRK